MSIEKGFVTNTNTNTQFNGFLDIVAPGKSLVAEISIKDVNKLADIKNILEKIPKPLVHSMGRIPNTFQEITISGMIIDKNILKITVSVSLYRLSYILKIANSTEEWLKNTFMKENIEVDSVNVYMLYKKNGNTTKLPFNEDSMKWINILITEKDSFF